MGKWCKTPNPLAPSKIMLRFLGKFRKIPFDQNVFVGAEKFKCDFKKEHDLEKSQTLATWNEFLNAHHQSKRVKSTRAKDSLETLQLDQALFECKACGFVISYHTWKILMVSRFYKVPLTMTCLTQIRMRGPLCREGGQTTTNISQHSLRMPALLSSRILFVR